MAMVVPLSRNHLDLWMSPTTNHPIEQNRIHQAVNKEEASGNFKFKLYIVVLIQSFAQIIMNIYGSSHTISVLSVRILLSFFIRFMRNTIQRRHLHPYLALR